MKWNPKQALLLQSLRAEMLWIRRIRVFLYKTAKLGSADVADQNCHQEAAFATNAEHPLSGRDENNEVPKMRNVIAGR